MKRLESVPEARTPRIDRPFPVIGGASQEAATYQLMVIVPGRGAVTIPDRVGEAMYLRMKEIAANKLQRDISEIQDDTRLRDEFAADSLDLNDILSDAQDLLKAADQEVGIPESFFKVVRTPRQMRDVINLELSDDLDASNAYIDQRAKEERMSSLDHLTGKDFIRRVKVGKR